jgi:hypothetical protein
MQKPRARLHILQNLRLVEKSEAKALGLPSIRLSKTDLKDVRYIEDRSKWLELDPQDGWTLFLRVSNQRGHPIISEVRLFPAEARKRRPAEWSGAYGADTGIPKGGITARQLRAVRLGQFHPLLHRVLARWEQETPSNLKRWNDLRRGAIAKGDEKGEPMTHAEQQQGIAAARAKLFPWANPQSLPAKTRGRKGRSVLELARMSAAYEKACLVKRPPIPEVAKHFHLSYAEARDAIHRARVLGLLTGGGRKGKGGGYLTSTAKTILKSSGKLKRKGRTYGTTR